MSDRYDALQPVQIATTLRSLPRRVREQLAGLPADDRDALARVDHGGTSVLGVVHDIAASLELLTHAVHLGLLRDDATAPGAAGAATARFALAPDASLGGEVDTIARVVDAAAAEIDAARDRDWDRTVTVDGTTMTTLALARAAARAGAERLRTLEATVRAVQATLPRGQARDDD